MVESHHKVAMDTKEDSTLRSRRFSLRTQSIFARQRRADFLPSALRSVFCVFHAVVVELTDKDIGGTSMALKTPQQYVQSLRDGRVTYWDGERIDDITNHPRFRVPIANTAKDYEYDSPELSVLRRYKTEDGGEAHRIFQ